MRTLLIALSLTLILGLPLPVGAQPHPAPNGGSRPEASGDMSRNLAMIAGGALGLLLASGAVNLLAAGTLMYEGAAVAEGLEAGAGLSMPIAVLSGVLGAIFGQDFLLRNFNFNMQPEAPKPAAH